MYAGTSYASVVFPYSGVAATITMSPTSKQYSSSTGSISQITISHQFAPATTNTYNLGSATNRWYEVYAHEGTINTSDRNEKRDISYDLSRYDEFFAKLKPCEFKFKGSDDRKHLGFIAQDVEVGFQDAGMVSEEHAMVKHEQTPNGEFYGLAYSELHALAIAQIQKLNEAVSELEKKVQELEEKLQKQTS